MNPHIVLLFDEWKDRSRCRGHSRDFVKKLGSCGLRKSPFADVEVSVLLTADEWFTDFPPLLWSLAHHLIMLTPADKEVVEKDHATYGSSCIVDRAGHSYRVKTICCSTMLEVLYSRHREDVNRDCLSVCDKIRHDIHQWISGIF